MKTGEAQVHSNTHSSTTTPGESALAQGPAFDVTEKSILDLQAAQTDGRVTARVLVEQYLARIRAYDQVGPELNAIVTLNPRALEEADALDRERQLLGPRGPLHGIPILIKDNFETKDMPTTGGTLALARFQTERDAFQVARLRQAGAVLLGKTTLHELSAGITTISSLTGQTRNPYDLNRVPGGSSGGTAAAVAASFAAAGMGSDTCGSIRIPAANQNLVGLRVTRGLSSRSGIIPLSPTQDEAGPIARCVADLALMLEATVGPDPNDPVTVDASRHVPRSYFDLLPDASFQGKRIGVLKSLFGQTPEDTEVASITYKALEAMKDQGVELVEISVPRLDELMQGGDVIVHEFKFALADYLARHPSAAVKSLQELLDKGLHHQQLEPTFQLRNEPRERKSEAYRTALAMRNELRERMISIQQSEKLDAVAYPVLRRKAALIGQAQSGLTSQLSAYSGLPAISVPAGFTNDGVPVGMELLAQPYKEPELLKLAYALEKLTKLRQAPFSTPPLVGGLAPRPVQFQVVAEADANAPIATVTFRYDSVTAKLHYSVFVQRIASADVLAVTLQRGSIVSHLLRAGQVSAESEVVLDFQSRQALLNGQLFVHFYARQDPLGTSRVCLKLPDQT